MSLRGVRSTTWESQHKTAKIIVPNQIATSPTAPRNDTSVEIVAHRFLAHARNDRTGMSSTTRFFTSRCFAQNDTEVMRFPRRVQSTLLGMTGWGVVVCHSEEGIVRPWESRLSTQNWSFAKERFSRRGFQPLL